MKQGMINVLLVDDNSHFLEGLRTLLKGYTNINILGTAVNGQEAVLHPLLHEAHVVVMDINMPKLGGISAAKLINQKYNHIHLIATTLHEDAIYLDELILAGFKAFVTKGNVIQELHTKISKVINKNYSFPTGLNMHASKS
jgi:DNA-binding NarL/FixJ family response regulator